MSVEVTMPEVDRVAASRAAVAVRRERAALKDDLRTGERRHQQVLVEAMNVKTGVAGGLRVTEFLATLPFVGRVKTERIMADLGISPRKRLGGLGQQQAKNLWDFLGEWLVRHPIEIREGIDS